MKITKILGFAALVFLFASCQKDNEVTPSTTQKGDIEVKFDNIVGKEDLQISTKSYINSSNEDFTVTTLRYFVSNFKFKTADGKEYVVPQDSCYFLIDESNVNSQKIKLKNLPEGDYTQFSFVLGVDSTRNTLDVAKRGGSLDIGGQASGMYWSWNSGYIFFKMEGTSQKAPADPTGKNMYRYHIGGFGGMSSKTINNLKTITLPLGSGAKIRKTSTPSVHLMVDISKVFVGKNTVKIAENPTVMFNTYSTKIAENYADMFVVDHIH